MSTRPRGHAISRPGRLGRRLIARRRSAASLLFAAGVVFALVVVGVALLGHSADLAARASVKADLGDRAYAVTARTDQGVKLLDDDDRFVPIAELDLAVSTSKARLPAAVRITPIEQPLPLGLLVFGHHPTRTGEAALSRKIAHDLGVSVGDYVQLPDAGVAGGEVRVVGIIADPSNATAATIALLGEVDLEDVVSWVSQVDPYSIPELQGLLDARVLTYQSSDSLEEARVKQLPSTVGLLRRLPLSLGAVLAVLVGTIVLSLRRIARRDHAALRAAGMSARRSHRMLAGVAAALILAGQFVGIIAAVAFVWICRSPISSQFGQDWVALSFPWAAAVSVIVLIPVAAGLARPAARIGTRVTSSYQDVARRLVGPGPGLALGAIGLILLAIAAAARTQSPPGQLVRLAPFGAVAAVAAVAILARLIVSSRLRPGMKALVRVLTANVVVVAALGGVIAVGGAAYAATATRDANGFSTLTRAPQPPGSLLVTEVPTPAAETIVAAYEGLGGADARRYTLPDESSTQVRVTGTRLVECLESATVKDPNNAPDDCFPQGTMSPVAIVAFSRNESDDSDSTADPGLVTNDEVGLLSFDVGSPIANRLAVTGAIPDKSLGGNMPGLVIPVDGKVAKALDLRPGKTELVALLGFNDLSGSQQARLRSTIAGAAPTAQVADATTRQGYERDKALATSVAVAGAALVILITLSGTAAVLTGHRKIRRNLADVGANPGQGRRLAVLWSASLFITYAGSIALGWLAARLAGINIDASYGWTWTLPGAAGLLATTAFLLSCTRVPTRASE